MVTVKGNKATFTGKDRKSLQKLAKDLGLSPQDTFTGLLWEAVMRKARQGVFKGEKAKTVEP